MKNLIELKHIGVQRARRWLLRDVSLRVAPGEIVTIIGPNGAGKTTLLKVLLGLWQPDQGTVQRDSAMVIGYMPQHLHVELTIPLTVERFLRLGQSAVTASDIQHVMQQVRLTLDVRHSFHDLSGGERQRVLLARALLRKPQLLVLDEPAHGVDISGQVDFYELLDVIRKKYHCGIVQVSHDLHLVMAATDNVVCLNQHICCSGHPEIVSQDPAFLQLFGSAAKTLALYHHHHDHQHTPTGDVIPHDR